MPNLKEWGSGNDSFSGLKENLTAKNVFFYFLSGQ